MKSTRQPSKPLKQEPKADKSQPQIILNSADEPTERQADQYQPISASDERPLQQVSEDAIADTINPEQKSKPARASKP